MDIAHRETEKVLADIEKRLKKEYSRAAKDMEQKVDKYFEAFRRKDTQKRNQFMRHEITKEEYDRWRYGQLAVGKRWEDMRSKLADDMTHTDVIARSIVDGYMPEVYANNHNFATYQIEKAGRIDTSYTLYDAQSVERLVRDNPQILPKVGRTTKELIDKGILKKWNMKNIQSTMIQGILQGESITKLAKRMAADVGAMNYKDCVRHARTMTTATQNAGRVDGFKRAKDMGIGVKQTWVATLDGRTRHEHRFLDGQTQEVGEPFVTDDNRKIMYPADPSADYDLIMNCRCTLIGQVKGFERDTTAYRHDPDLDGMTYEEWKKGKPTYKPTAKPPKPAQTPAAQSKPAQPTSQPAATAQNTAQIDGYNWIVNAANADKVAHNPVGMLKKPLTDEEIITKIAGGDQTKGSCASLSICYAANKQGIDVDDFRGGNSQKLFSRRANNQKVYEAANAKIDVYMVKKEAKEVAEILKGIDQDKEFILSAGRHSAVVKRTADGLQYLELQSPIENGWKPFGDDVAATLRDRWACRKTQERILGTPVEQRVRLIDVDSIQPTAEFKGILGYINTPAAKQKRGATGGIK